MSFSITSLEYNAAVNYADIYPSLVQLCSSLRFLSLLLPTNYHDENPQLAFPQLENLRLSIPFDFRLGACALPGKCPPCAACGWPTITFLSLYSNPTADLQEILDNYPEHLLMGPRVQIMTLASCQHQTIKSWAQWAGPWISQPSALFNLLSAGFPASRACRNLDATFAHLWDLPVRFPPSTAQEQAVAGNYCGNFLRGWRPSWNSLTRSRSTAGPSPMSTPAMTRKEFKISSLTLVLGKSPTLRIARTRTRARVSRSVRRAVSHI
ncbi:hypothetical protein B0H19DRAFT_59896 [Mycena capillaripes]|nr:hypothetical protein B0H19DRAFT_59896 [Mycena capillaripes]